MRTPRNKKKISFKHWWVDKLYLCISS